MGFSSIGNRQEKEPVGDLDNEDLRSLYSTKEKNGKKAQAEK
jgi:hypothetical protein